jgi:hypothetical protein
LRTFLIAFAILAIGIVAGSVVFGRQMLDVAYAATYRDRMVDEFRAGCQEAMRAAHAPADRATALCACFSDEFRTMAALRAAWVVMNRAATASAPEFEACRTRRATS